MHNAKFCHVYAKHEQQSEKVFVLETMAGTMAILNYYRAMAALRHQIIRDSSVAARCAPPCSQPQTWPPSQDRFLILKGRVISELH
jgi:hypothetical protein